MALSVKRWTTRRLLYPIAIFAIIAPTVVLGLFGAYALRQIELRPSLYRQELREIQTGLETAINNRLSGLSIKPPAGPDDIERVDTQVGSYFADYNRAVSSRCYIGVNGQVIRKRSIQQTDDFETPIGLTQFVRGIETGQRQGVTRHAANLRWPAENQRAASDFVVFVDHETGGFVAWEIMQPQIDQTISHYLDAIELDNDALVLESATRGELDWRMSPTRGYETLGFVPAHSEVLPSRFVILKLDTNRQFLNDDTWLSSIFVIIAVLCVPIVASATLMVVHMILREASEARKKVDFVSNVTHELKTPLTSIRMFVETLKLGRAKNEDQMNACLDVIMSETDRLGALIDHVLSFSKVENQVKKYNIQPNNLAQVVKDTVALFRAQIPEDHRDAIRLKVLPGLPSQAQFDKDAIREVLLNLLSNAIKYSADEKFVTVRVGTDRNDLFVEVADRGVGIPPEDQSRIFEKFFRVDQALSRKVDGTGLGLAICKEIVQAHGGRIVLESMWGKGSRFTVFIPYKPPRATRRPTTSVRQSSRELKIPTGEGV